MPNDNRQMGTTHQRAILYELKQIKELLQEQTKEESYDPNHGACCRNGCEKCEQ